MKANGLRFKVESCLVQTGLRILGCTNVSVKHEVHPFTIVPITLEWKDYNVPLHGVHTQKRGTE